MGSVVSAVAGAPNRNYLPYASVDGSPALSANLEYPSSIRIAPDGSLYVSDFGSGNVHGLWTGGIRRVDLQHGTISTVLKAGNVSTGVIPPLAPEGIAFAPDGSFYFADNSGCIFYVNLAHQVLPFAGAFSQDNPACQSQIGSQIIGDSPDGTPALNSSFGYPTSVAVGPDGWLYMADRQDHKIRMVANGVISTVAGTPANINGSGFATNSGTAGDGGIATKAQLNGPTDIRFSPSGDLYIADTYNSAVRRIHNGVITTVVGMLGQPGYSGDGGPATQAHLRAPTGIAFGRDGTLYIADTNAMWTWISAQNPAPSPWYGGVVRAVSPSGIISTIAGIPVTQSISQPIASGLGGPAGSAAFATGFLWQIEAAPDGSLYLGGGACNEAGQHAGNVQVAVGPQQVLKIAPPLPGFSNGAFSIPSVDATQLYDFDPFGKHLDTRLLPMGNIALTLGYDAGVLTQLVDQAQPSYPTTITRNGTTITITSPYGNVTTLTLDANGYLSQVEDPSNFTFKMLYRTTQPGLLTNITYPNGKTSKKDYDALGRVAHSEDAEPNPPNQTTLTRVEDTPTAVEVKKSTIIGAVTDYNIAIGTDAGAQTWVTTYPDTSQETLNIAINGTRTTTETDGTQSVAAFGPDPRFGMATPVATSATETTPVNKVQGSASYSRSADAGADASPATNPLALLTETETATVNGRTTTTTWAASPNAFVTTLNSGRQSTAALDSTGLHIAEYRPFETPSGTFTQAPTSFPSYEGHGRLTEVTRGTRATNYTYDLDTPGYLSKVVVSDSSPSDSGFSQETDFSHDGAGRITAIKFPDGNQVAMAYDPSGNGNVTAITPPGGIETDAGVNTTTKTHSFAYNGIGLLSTYTPPGVSEDGTGSTSYTWDGDRHLTNIARPDGTQVS